MIERLEISNFRGITHEVIEFRPLTIFTGINSAGKSTCINAILNLLYYNNCPNAKDILRPLDFTFPANRNKNVNATYYDIRASFDNGRELTVHKEMGADAGIQAVESEIDLEKNFYFLSANRLGYSYEMESQSESYSVGLMGEYLFGTLQRDGSERVEDELDVQQCADSVMRIYAEYFRKMTIISSDSGKAVNAAAEMILCE